LAMTATVKAIDSQRWIWRIHVFQINGTSSQHEPKADRALSFRLPAHELRALNEIAASVVRPASLLHVRRAMLILPLDQIIRAGRQAVWIAKSFHQQELERVPVNALTRQPISQLALATESSRANSAPPPSRRSSSGKFRIHVALSTVQSRRSSIVV